MNFPIQHRQTRSQRLSLLISVVTHVAIGLLLIWFGIFSASGGSGPEIDRAGGIVLTEISAQQDVEYIDQTDAEQSQISDAFEALEESEDAEAVSAAPSALTAASAEAPEMDVPEMPDLPGVAVSEIPTINANNMARAPVLPSRTLSHEISKEDLEQFAKDRAFFKSLQPKGEATTINLFQGGGLTGRKFVFVIDRSHSMGGDGLGVLDQARKQLTAAIDTLENNHEFQIVAYHNKTTMISERKLLVANDANKQLVRQFFEGLGAFGATNHFYGLIGGLQFQPDVLVLMTDGGSPALSPNKLKDLKRHAGRKTEIHCIQFGSGPSQTPRNFMRTLAQQNRGTFRYIDVRQWR